ncbi:general substrate transporter [Zopfia rhizophila CBS 207.26]|uniref:General substrate transporter n=1 Tax=Zopfia rhizophila CBS 207.26 TaxID=1314779 RepID=A0A6A6E5N2_9PEZI|nr:general substrate transporter [Zopfia rhizophila CBS 207.26]
MCSFPYDGGLIGGLNVVPSFREALDLNSTYTGLNVAIVNLGCVAGVPLSSYLLHRWGWKKGLMVANLFGIVGALISALSVHRNQLLAGRFLLGISFPISGAGAPAWVMEIAPEKHRLVLTNLMITALPFAGMISAIIVLYTSPMRSSWAWRSPILGEMFGPLVSLLLLPLCPESPRWLAGKGYSEAALTTMAQLHKSGDVTHPFVVADYETMMAYIHADKGVERTMGWKNLISPPSNRRRFIIAVLAFLFLQVSSCNFVLYFATIILHAAGIKNTETLLKLSVGACAFAVASNISGIYLVERLGRKFMFILATGISMICLIVFSIVTNLSEKNHLIRYGIVAAIFIFIFQWASFAAWYVLPLAYSYPPEILKHSQRAKGLSVSQAIGYAFATLMAYTIPMGIEHISWRFYIINAIWNLGIMAVIWFYFIETKGKTMEQINLEFEGIQDVTSGSTEVLSCTTYSSSRNTDVDVEGVTHLKVGERKADDEER